MSSYFAIVLAAILVNNVVLAQFLGICPFLGVSKKLDSAVGMSIAVTFVLVIAAAVTWPIYTFLLYPHDLGYLNTMVFILVIAALVQLVETTLKKYIPALYKSLGIYLPLITTNCAVLGITLKNIENAYGFGEAMVNSFGTGVGFLLAMVLFAGVRSRIEACDVPECFKGIPITLVAASIMAVAFMGFSGVITGIFGA